MTKELYFNLDPDSIDAFGDISDVLKDTIKRFDSLNKTVMKQSGSCSSLMRSTAWSPMR